MTVALLEKGANKNMANINGWTPLMLASKYGHLEVVRQLLQSGADKALKDNYNGMTALDWARQEKKDAVVALLQVKHAWVWGCVWKV